MTIGGDQWRFNATVVVGITKVEKWSVFSQSGKETGNSVLIRFNSRHILTWYLQSCNRSTNTKVKFQTMLADYQQ